MREYMKRRTLVLLTGLLLAAGASHAQTASFGAREGETDRREFLTGSPKIALKSNLLYDATATINVGAEFGLGRRLTLDFPISYNPWTFADNAKWRHILVQPELRFWNCNAFGRGFWGLHAHYAFYNVGGLPNPPFSEYMNTHRFQGWLAGLGISYGYQWILGKRWSLEATIGAGWAYMKYDIYPCEKCGDKIGSATKNYFGPTKAGITLIYIIK